MADGRLRNYEMEKEKRLLIRESETKRWLICRVGREKSEEKWEGVDLMKQFEPIGQFNDVITRARKESSFGSE